MSILGIKYKDVKEEFAKLYNENFDYVYSFILSRTAGDEKLAEDIVQEAFTAAWISFGRFKNESSYGTWLCSIARNKLYEYYRRKTRSERFEIKDNDSIEELSSNYNLEEIVLSREEYEVVNAVLGNINPLYRYCLVLKYIDECSIKEIADILGRTNKAVDSMLQRAKVSFIREFLRLSGKENENEK